MSTLAPAPTQSTRVRATLDTVWRDLVYLLGAFTMSIVGFVVWVTGLSVTVSLLVLIVGVFVWVGTVYVFRWTTAVDRKLAGWLRRSPIPAVYRPPTEPRFLDLLKTMTTDPQTWKEADGSSRLDRGLHDHARRLTATTLVLAWITLPIWWWAIPDPHSPVRDAESRYLHRHLARLGVRDDGARTRDRLPVALLLNRAVAAGHAAIAARVLGPSERQQLQCARQRAGEQPLGRRQRDDAASAHRT